MTSSVRCAMTYKTKTCQRCGKEYTPQNGYQEYCVECGHICKHERRLLSDAAWREANPEKYCKEKADSVKRRKSSGKWWKASPEDHRKWNAKWYKANAAKRRIVSANYHKANAEKCSKSSSKYRRAHLEVGVLAMAKRRSLKYGNTPHDKLLTPAEWLAILAEHHGRCHYCSKKAKLTLDHVIPLSKGGKHSKDNVVPACSHCNSSKGAKGLEEWFVLGVAS